MPPRRSCFATCRFPSRPSPSVSMPPRRSCFASLTGLVSGLVFVFQCHHGVPASRSVWDVSAVDGNVSMPPRRSCFSDLASLASRVLKRFNATTAFLLPDYGASVGSYYFGFNATTAFLLLCPHRSSEPDRPGFNATTAFLLRYKIISNIEIKHRFNATTAFLLRDSCRRFTSILTRFQCHHGVLASFLEEHTPDTMRQVSMPPRRSCFGMEGGAR